MKINYYTKEPIFINCFDRIGPPQLGQEIVIKNPSGFIYTGNVVSVKAHPVWDDEIVVMLDGSWEWEKTQ